MTTNFIHIPTNKKGGQGYLKVKKEYIHTFDTKLYEEKNNQDQIKIYEEIYEYFKNTSKINKNDKYIILSPDTSVTCPIIAGLNEQYIYRESEKKFNSDLRVLYISPLPDLAIIKSEDLEYENSDVSMSTLFNLTDTPMINNKLIFNPEQVIYFGLNDKILPNDQKELLDQLNLTYYTYEQIIKKGADKILNNILSEYKDRPLHVHIDLKVFSKQLAPSTVTLNDYKEGFNNDILKFLLNILKNKVNSIDITGFDDSIDSKSGVQSRLTSELAKSIFINIFDIKEKKINIYNENSRFLIYRPRKQKSEEDIGWFIVRFMDIETKEKILNNIKDGSIIYINIEDENGDEEEVMITTTTIDEQTAKSYFTAISVDECTLLPQEKMLMWFELIN